MTGGRVTTSRKRRGCDCKNKSPRMQLTANSGRCEHCQEVIAVTGTGTDLVEREAPCFFIAIFECDHYTQDDEREHVTTPCLVLRKRCVRQECIWDSRWSCLTGDPNLDQPTLSTRSCYQGQNADDGYAEFQPCRDVIRCGGTMFVLDGGSPGAEGFPVGLPACNVSDQFNVLCCTYYWIFDDVQIHELCPEFADIWAGVDSRDVGQVASCCYCEDYESEGNGPSCERGGINEGLVIDCPHDRQGFPDWDCCDTRTLVEFDPAPYSYVLDCIKCRQDQDVPTDEEYEAFFADPTQYCNGQILHNGAPVEGCTWADQPCSGPDLCATPGTEFGEGTGSFGDEIDGLDCYTKWQLEPVSPTVCYLRGRTRRGYTANYVCNNWNCYERRTFTMQPGDYSPELIGLPLCVCVYPHNYRSASCASSGQLACCDTGEGSISVEISIADCEGELVYDRQRIAFSRGGPLPCGVANPFPTDPCLYFTASIGIDAGCAEWGPDLFVVMYCSAHTPAEVSPPCGIGDPGGPFKYNFVYYCFDNEEQCWIEVGSSCQSYECGCFGPNPPEFFYQKDCCCEDCCPCLADDFKTVEIVATRAGCGSVTTLSANISSTDGICQFNIDGSSEDCGTFQGTLQCPSGTESGFTLDATLVCGDDPNCSISWSVHGDGTDTATMELNSCDPLDLTVTHNLSGDVIQITEV